MSQIIFLHGASSSGKSMIARALQHRIDEPFWHVSIDHLRDAGVLPLIRYRRGDFDWQSDRAKIFDGFHKSLAAYATAGNNLILEHILDTPRWAEELQVLFRPHDVLFVAVQCPVAVLVERERDRGDRPQGSAERDQATIHLDRRYDLEVNSVDDVDANVRAILQAWHSGLRRSEFSQTLA
ncbi:AAA family ATPase [Rhodobacteraceae bacterium B1Z28]|uniref:AAA family ATPase n=1 Tax=Ruegeria haliotis TaxID=2747601 RepID=A0ABX2PVX0_9RHOB|nr:AAA family ATPase [Ruegeria haliotis]NVO58173.1 AAA family ATPase [Ruegeria haliotis]